jgi:glycosyltransferase involved in cell wall biosynthesis
LRSGGGIRVKILEAMALKKIVISSDVGIQGIDATPGKHYLAASTKEELINAVKWCLENKERAMEIGEQAAQLVKDKYERRNITKRIINKLNLMRPASH